MAQTLFFSLQQLYVRKQRHYLHKFRVLTKKMKVSHMRGMKMCEGNRLNMFPGIDNLSRKVIMEGYT